MPSASAPPASASVRPAATVVMLRPEGARTTVFMLRRSPQSPFMPSTLVFPGGRLDAADGPPLSDESFARAAARECLEEAGVALSVPDLRWFDTWCTPSAEPRRYLARFFLAYPPQGQAAQAQADGHETQDGRWACADEHLQAWSAGQVDLPPPTLAVLLQLRDQGPEFLAARALAELADPIVPKLVHIDAAATIVMPHDPEYPQLDGAQAPAPPRARSLPKRFVRTENRWIPC